MALRQKYAWSDLIIAEQFEFLKRFDYQPDYIHAPRSCQALLPVGRIGPSWSKLIMAGVHFVDFKIILTAFYSLTSNGHLIACDGGRLRNKTPNITMLIKGGTAEFNCLVTFS